MLNRRVTYTLPPHKVWQQIELSPKRSVTFTLVDGTTIEGWVSECHEFQRTWHGASPRETR